MSAPRATTREEFADLANYRGYKRAVEIGTDQGMFAARFLERWTVPDSWLYTVDPYGPHPGIYTPRLADSMIAVIHLARFAGRVRLFGEPSVEAAKILASWKWHPEFVHIDGDHSREATSEDMRAWWPLVAPGGILSGHDYGREAPGVMAAVDEFVSAHRLSLNLTSDCPASWWVEKVS